MPKPQVQILVCTNERAADAPKPSCGPCGGLELYRGFKDGVRARGLRNQVMVVRTGCLKHCSQGVTVALWPHNFWYRQVRPEDIDEILETSVQDGREVARLAMPDIPWE